MNHSAGLAFAAAIALSAVAPAQNVRRECFMLQALDGSAPYVSDAAECSVRAAPASTFKIPHALIALETGVVSEPFESFEWDGTERYFPVWERDHSLDSALKWSVVWFFERTARSIGLERMREHLGRLRYAEDTFERDVASFWLNGDLVVSPEEQHDFLRRWALYDLPVQRQHVDAVKAALLMPGGKITNAAGTHDFALDWPGSLVLRAKTGFTTVGEERVSWLVGHLDSNGRQYVFVSRVRASESLPGTAAMELARELLAAHSPGSAR